MESLTLSQIPSFSNRLISFCVASRCACGTGNGFAWYGLEPSFSSSRIGSMRSSPSPPPKSVGY